MNSRFVINNGSNRRLAILFLGWAMDANPFMAALATLNCGYDILAVWDYGDPTPLPCDDLSHYDEVCVVAWSMGVAFAPAAVAPLRDRITKMIAVNGTMTPVDDELGIPTAIYNATLEAMDPRNLQKFYRRVCGTGDAYRIFCLNMPQRDITQLIDELKLMTSTSTSSVATDNTLHSNILQNPLPYSLAVVSGEDAIFPPANQTRAWQRLGVDVEEIDGPHLPDFRALLSRHLINKDLVRRRFSAAAATYEDNTPAQFTIAHNLVMMYLRNSEQGARSLLALEIGPGSGTLTRGLLEVLPTDTSLALWDITPCHPSLVAPSHSRLTAASRLEFTQCDAEMKIRETADETYDIIFSASTIQWFNSLPVFFDHAARVLRPGGLMCVSSFVAGNLPEITQVFGTSLNLPDRDRWVEIVSRHFDIVDVSTPEIVLPFDTPRAMLEHIKLSGVNAIGDSPASTAAVRRFLSGNYPTADVCEANRVTLQLTYRPILMLLKKK